MDGGLILSERTRPAQRPARADGAIGMTVDCQGGRARVRRVYQRQPLRILLPKPAAGEPLTAVLANLSGGMVGGDRYDVAVAVKDGGDVLICGQAAEKVYRSDGTDTDVAVALSAAEDAALEWLPQGTILFDGARLRRKAAVDLAESARLLAGEILVFGRLGMGEIMSSGLVRDDWRIRVGGRLVWADALALDGDIGETLNHPAALAGGRALATIALAAPGADRWLEPVRDMLAETPDTAVRSAATAWPGFLLVRMLSTDPAALRRAFGRGWAWLRATALGRPAHLPVIWHV